MAVRYAEWKAEIKCSLIDSKPLRVVIKSMSSADNMAAFHRDYNAEAEYTRRLNMAGCNEVITVIDVGPPFYRLSTWADSRVVAHFWENPSPIQDLL